MRPFTKERSWPRSLRDRGRKIRARAFRRAGKRDCIYEEENYQFHSYTGHDHGDGRMPDAEETCRDDAFGSSEADRAYLRDGTAGDGRDASAVTLREPEVRRPLRRGDMCASDARREG